MKFKTASGLHVVMRAYKPGEEVAIAELISSYEVSRYISVAGSQTAAQEAEWIDKLLKESNSVHWAICVAEGKRDLVGRTVGTSTLSDIDGRRAVSGVVIYDRSVWRQGLASACHRARCFYANRVLGLCAIDSSVIRGNQGSLRALRGVGYEVVGTHMAEHFIDGQWRHHDELTWVNPSQGAWQQFWGDTEIPKSFKKARQRAAVALAQAEREVTFL